MFNQARSKNLPRSSWILGLSALVGAGVVSALWNQRADKRAEQRNPPHGRRLDVDGVKLHYLDTCGSQPAVLLIHGNAVTSADMEVSGMIDALKDRHQVIAFDRPGYGYSERPHDKSWTPEEQADLLAKALEECKVENAIVFGHSWGALVAVAFALRHPQMVKGLVLASGYYFPTVRSDVIMSSIATAPLLGDLMRLTISPLIGRLMAPAAFAAMFDPLPIPQRFRERFPASLSFRTTQLRASTEEGSMMTAATRRLSSHYGAIVAPVTIMAGTSDKIVDFERQSQALHDVLPRSVLKLFPGVGHMVHYAATAEVAAALDNSGTEIESLAVANNSSA
jgi:pimeloyl-ACP methyl ester carboxylesterase